MTHPRSVILATASAIVLVSALIVVNPVGADSFAPAGAGFSLDWFTHDGGGGVSSSGTLQVVGTIGQPDAGTLTGGTFELQGGFMSGTPLMLPDCPADVDGSGHVGINDFLAVLAEWGCTSGCTADTSGPEGVPDDMVGIHDFLAVLANWGLCP